MHAFTSLYSLVRSRTLDRNGTASLNSTRKQRIKHLPLLRSTRETRMHLTSVPRKIKTEQNEKNTLGKHSIEKSLLFSFSPSRLVTGMWMLQRKKNQIYFIKCIFVQKRNYFVHKRISHFFLFELFAVSVHFFPCSHAKQICMISFVLKPNVDKVARIAFRQFSHNLLVGNGEIL